MLPCETLTGGFTAKSVVYNDGHVTDQADTHQHLTVITPGTIPSQLLWDTLKKTKLHGLSQRANYTD
jgi:hypothetical protein